MAISNPLIQNIPTGNPVTKEVLQEALPISVDTGYSTQNTKQPYYELVTYSFNPGQEGTYTQSVVYDFILTSIISTIAAPSNQKDHTLYINGNPIVMLSAPTDVSAYTKIDFPGVIIRKNSELKLIATESGGATSVDCLHVFVGYQL